MKAKLFFVLAALCLVAFTSGAAPARALTCAQMCAQTHCMTGRICGLHFNTFGTLVCGCYDPNSGN